MFEILRFRTSEFIILEGRSITFINKKLRAIVIILTTWMTVIRLVPLLFLCFKFLINSRDCLLFSDLVELWLAKMRICNAINFTSLIILD